MLTTLLYISCRRAFISHCSLISCPEQMQETPIPQLHLNNHDHDWHFNRRDEATAATLSTEITEVVRVDNHTDWLVFLFQFLYFLIVRQNAILTQTLFLKVSERLTLGWKGVLSPSIVGASVYVFWGDANSFEQIIGNKININRLVQTAGKLFLEIFHTKWYLRNITVDNTMVNFQI